MPAAHGSWTSRSASTHPPGFRLPPQTTHSTRQPMTDVEAKIADVAAAPAAGDAPAPAKKKKASSSLFSFGFTKKAKGADETPYRVPRLLLISHRGFPIRNFPSGNFPSENFPSGISHPISHPAHTVPCCPRPPSPTPRAARLAAIVLAAGSLTRAPLPCAEPEPSEGARNAEKDGSKSGCPCRDALPARPTLLVGFEGPAAARPRLRAMAVLSHARRPRIVRR
eukprot:SAG31_NODE_153_length_22196_cov_24.963570_18_plen_224_part_00